MMAETFSVPLAARSYEIDSNGHVAATVLLQYGQHARWECLRAAGIDHAALAKQGLGPVSLEEHIRFHREVKAGDEIAISCTFHWGAGKTFRIQQELRHSDGTLLAEITAVGGLLDLTERRLRAEPETHWRAAATVPELLGL